MVPKACLLIFLMQILKNLSTITTPISRLILDFWDMPQLYRTIKKLNLQIPSFLEDLSTVLSSRTIEIERIMQDYSSKNQTVPSKNAQMDHLPISEIEFKKLRYASPNHKKSNDIYFFYLKKQFFVKVH